MERFGKYVLLEKIGHGGMAEIYRAKLIGEDDSGGDGGSGNCLNLYIGSNGATPGCIPKIELL